MSRIRVAVIGVGHLGKEHARILAGMDDVELAGVADVNPQQAEMVAFRCQTQAYTDCNELVDEVDAAVIAVPTSCHREVSSAFLERGIACLVEKPLAPTLADALAIEHLARRTGAILQVGHIERFNPAWEELMGRPLRPKLINSERLAPFSGRGTDVGVVADLMIHDLDLVLSAVASPIVHVEAVGVSVLGQHEDMVQARLRFENGSVAHLRSSRMHPTGSRRMQLWGAEGFADIDFARRSLTLMQPSDQLQAMHLGLVRLDSGTLASLKGNLHSRHLQSLTLDCVRPCDQLTSELHDFVRAVRMGETPRVTGEDGCRAVAAAERVIQAVAAHRWDGTASGPVGPFHLPASQGQLFTPTADEAVA